MHTRGQYTVHIHLFIYYRTYIYNKKIIKKLNTYIQTSVYSHIIKDKYNSNIWFLLKCFKYIVTDEKYNLATDFSIHNEATPNVEFE